MWHTRLAPDRNRGTSSAVARHPLLPQGAVRSPHAFAARRLLTIAIAVLSYGSAPQISSTMGKTTTRYTSVVRIIAAIATCVLIRFNREAITA